MRCRSRSAVHVNTRRAAISSRCPSGTGIGSSRRSPFRRANPVHAGTSSFSAAESDTRERRPQPPRDDRGEPVGGALAVGPRHVAVGDGAHDARRRGPRSARRPPCARGDDRGGVRQRPAPCWKITMLVCTVARSSATPGNPARRSAMQPGVGVVVGEPRDVVVERVEAGRREDARLPHRAAEHAAAPRTAAAISRLCCRRARCRPGSPAPSTTRPRRGRTAPPARRGSRPTRPRR